MPEGKSTKEQNDAKLKSFIKSDGRKGAESDFNRILRKAVKPSQNKNPKKK